MTAPTRPTTLHVTRGEVWEVTLHRPDSANALSVDLVEDLLAVVDEASAAGPATASAQAPTALVLRGNVRHFAAGFDLAGLHDESDASLALRFLRIGLLLERLASAPVLTIAAVEGAAYGAGADLVACCDVRLATPTAGFRFPGARFGVVLGTDRLARLVGHADALALVGGPAIDAAEARRIGLVSELLPDAERLTAAIHDRVTTWKATTPASRPALLTAARPAGSDAALAALARSVAVPGLRERIAAYAGLTLTPSLKENV